MRQNQNLGLAALLAFGMLSCAWGALRAASNPGEEQEAGSAVLGPSEKTSVGAGRFLDSLGINVHIDQGYSAESYVEPLRYLGVRAIRTGAGRVQNSLKVAREAGVRVAIFANGGLVSNFIEAAK